MLPAVHYNFTQRVTVLKYVHIPAHKQFSWKKIAISGYRLIITNTSIVYTTNSGVKIMIRPLMTRRLWVMAAIFNCHSEAHRFKIHTDNVMYWPDAAKLRKGIYPHYKGLTVYTFHILIHCWSNWDICVNKELATAVNEAIVKSSDISLA